MELQHIYAYLSASKWMTEIEARRGAKPKRESTTSRYSSSRTGSYYKNQLTEYVNEYRTDFRQRVGINFIPD